MIIALELFLCFSIFLWSHNGDFIQRVRPASDSCQFLIFNRFFIGFGFSGSSESAFGLGGFFVGWLRAPRNMDSGAIYEHLASRNHLFAYN